MKYPEEVQKNIDFLDTYKQVDNLSEINCLHMYPKELAYPNGYYDSRFFELWAFNFTTKEKCNLGTHDAIKAIPNVPMQIIDLRIFADGSTFIKFNETVKIDQMLNMQAIYIGIQH